MKECHRNVYMKLYFKYLYYKNRKVLQNVKPEEEKQINHKRSAGDIS
jgi:hypothetical protein